MTGATIKMKATTRDAAAIETVAYRHCWRRNRQRHCRVVAYRPIYSNYYERDSNVLPYGTLIWWGCAKIVRVQEGVAKPESFPSSILTDCEFQIWNTSAAIGTTSPVCTRVA